MHHTTFLTMMSHRGFRIIIGIIPPSSRSTTSRPHHHIIRGRGLRTSLRESVAGLVVVPPRRRTISSSSSSSSSSRRCLWRIGHHRRDDDDDYGSSGRYIARRGATRSFVGGGKNVDDDAPVVVSAAATTTTTTPGVGSADGGGGGPSSTTSSSSSPLVVYEGPFASLTLKLKRISLTSAIIGVFGLPALSLFATSSSSASSLSSVVPPSGQLAVMFTAGVTAVGSTALLGYCFSPYVHVMERLPTPNYAADDGEEGEGGTAAGGGGDRNDNSGGGGGGGGLVRIVTRDILARKVETVFDPSSADDVTVPTKDNNSSRPFCNFVVRGVPMYVHPELIRDHALRVQLLGEEPHQANADARNKTKVDDDEFL